MIFEGGQFFGGEEFGEAGREVFAAVVAGAGDGFDPEAP